jgi:hypothetical protein
MAAAIQSPHHVAAAEAGRRGRVWPAVLLSGLLGGAAGAGGVLWLDRTGQLPPGAASQRIRREPFPVK